MVFVAGGGGRCWQRRRSCKQLPCSSSWGVSSNVPPRGKQRRLTTMAQQIRDIDAVIGGFGRFGYVADRPLVAGICLLVQLFKPLLIEGHAGVGKTVGTIVLASLL